MATTQISLVREHTEWIKPPRALSVPFELGRPFGVPDAPDFQKRVLVAALDLLEAERGPVLVDFPEEAPATDNLTGWACPVNLGPPPEHVSDPGDIQAALEREIAQLRPWYDLSVQRRGRTTVGVSGLEVEEAGRYMMLFLDGQVPLSPRPDLSAGDVLKFASEDLKAYYFEAATAKPGSVSSKQVADWFWGETTAGKLHFALKAIYLQSDDKMMQALGRILLVPMSQRHRAV